MNRKRTGSLDNILMVISLMFLITVSSASDPPVLREAFQDHFYIGTALNEYQLAGHDAGSIALVGKHFNSVTPENQLKWEKVHPKPGIYDFTLADSLVAFGRKHQMHTVGHVLVWHNQTPERLSGGPQ